MTECLWLTTHDALRGLGRYSGIAARTRQGVHRQHGALSASPPFHPAPPHPTPPTVSLQAPWHHRVENTFRVTGFVHDALVYRTRQPASPRILLLQLTCSTPQS